MSCREPFLNQEVLDDSQSRNVRAVPLPRTTVGSIVRCDAALRGTAREEFSCCQVSKIGRRVIEIDGLQMQNMGGAGMVSHNHKTPSLYS